MICPVYNDSMELEGDYVEYEKLSIIDFVWVLQCGKEEM